jgi:hypothetical protein
VNKCGISVKFRCEFIKNTQKGTDIYVRDAQLHSTFYEGIWSRKIGKARRGEER